MIDHQKTVENMKVYHAARLAASIGVTAPMVSMIAAGKYKHMNAPKAQRVLSMLRDRGILVEVGE